MVGPRGPLQPPEADADEGRAAFGRAPTTSPGESRPPASPQELACRHPPSMPSGPARRFSARGPRSAVGANRPPDRDQTPRKFIHVDVKKRAKIRSRGRWRVHGRAARPLYNRQRRASSSRLFLHPISR